MSIGKVIIYGDKLDLADELADEFVAPAKEAIGEAGDLLTEEVKRLLSLQHGTARTAAPAGAPPEEDSGALVASFTTIPPRVKGRVASSGTQSRHPGVNRLEVGKTDVRGIRTLPHPFLAPALANTEGPIDELLHRKLG